MNCEHCDARTKGKRASGWLVLACVVLGCGGPSQAPQRAEPASTGDPRPARATAANTATREEAEPKGARSPARESTAPDPAADPAESDPEQDAPALDWPKPQPVRTLADLLEVPDAASRYVDNLPRMEVDEARAAAAGIRKLEGERITLYTDLGPDEEVDVLPEVFRQAFAQWCEYFDVDPADHADWHATGFLMNDKEAFQRAGLLPDALPPFEHGFSWNYELWWNEQPSAYYRRHLLLHEGTHAFMNTVLRGCGPPWYMEGTAELLGTHRWHEGRLRLNYMPTSRDEVPMWGRVKMVQDEYAERRGWTLRRVLDYRPSAAYSQSEPYAWCWAASTLLDRDPRYRERFRQLGQFVLEPDFTARFSGLVGDDWAELDEQWQVFVADMEYGYDVARAAIEFKPGEPLAASGTTVRVAADRGWQSSGVRLEGGLAYRLRASGRYQVADQPQVWWCEPGGVSIRYYRGMPLGMLQVAVRVEPPAPDEPTALIRPIGIGLGTTLRPERSGTLYLRVNDSGAELDDNAGELVVHLQATSGG